MFRAIILSILRSIRLCDTTCGIMYSICGRSVVWKRRNQFLRFQTQHLAGCLLYYLWLSSLSSCESKSWRLEIKNDNKLKIIVIRWLIEQTCKRTRFLRDFRSIAVYTEVSCDRQDDRILSELIFDCETQCEVTVGSTSKVTVGSTSRWC
jgi:hypothetical protein